MYGIPVVDLLSLNPLDSPSFFVLVCRLVGYFQSKGIQPLPAIVAQEEDIIVEEEEEEIDLTLDISEGEIVVAGGGNYFRDAFA
jgi:hypothetical protein